jgi:Tfp pilus assembly protein PilZ
LTPFIALVALPSAQDLLLCAKHLFVAAMVAWVHPGPAGNRQNQNMTKVLGAANAGVALPSAQDLLLCAKHLFVAAMVAWVHPGLCRVSAIQNMTAGAALPPVLRFVIPRQRFVHGSHGVNFAPARR